MSGKGTRRSALLGLGASLLAAPALATPKRPPDVPSLREAGRAKGLDIGTAFSGNPDPRYRALVARQVGLITPEWCLKPGFLKPDRDGPYRFGEADDTYAFARAAKLKVHGHSLFWHGDRLKWVTGDEDARRAYRDLMRVVMTRYPQTVSWDVANEVLADPGPAMRDQPDIADPAAFVASLFALAAQLAPGRVLVLNDYNLDCGRDWCTDKRRRMLAFVDDLLRRRVPLKAVGLQSHLSSRHGLGLEETRAFVRAIGERGLEIHLSELDVNDVVLPEDITARDAGVATMYREYLTAMLEEPAVKRVVFWGLADSDHWLVREEAEDARPAGRSRPGLFDRDLKPKPAFFAVLDSLRAAPRR